MQAVAPGTYRVERLTGLIPPLLRKRTDGRTGWTRLGPLPLLPFRLTPGVAAVELRYRGPLRFLVDRLVPGTDGAWEGEATCLGIRYGRFRLVRRRGPGPGPASD